jgi:ABC-type transport system substrate-binding protein
MNPRLTRRAVLGGAAALPFLGRTGLAARNPGALTFALSSYPPSIQPWVNTGTAAASVKVLIYRGLLSFDRQGALKAELAESWAAEGPTTWVFRLRDAVFHNGETVTSADVKWTLEQIAAEKSTAHYRTEFQGVERIETPDAKTVRIVMKEPTVTLPLWMANFHMPIIWRKSEAASPVGVGPFVLKSQERGVALDLVAFDRFYRPGLPKLKSLRMIAYADENLRVAALRAGDVDLIEYVPWQSMDAILADPRLTLDTVDGPFMYLTFNGGRPPFNDARVRRAVAHAVKREDIVNAVFFGRGSSLEHLPISDASEFYNADLKSGWRYDPDLAKKLLAEAGVAKGFPCKLLSTAQYGMHKDTAEIVQQHLAAIGIEAELLLPDWATRVQLGTRGQFELSVMGTATDTNDPDALSNVLDGSLAPSYARSYALRVPTIEALLKSGRAELDPVKRKAVYAEAERVALVETPIVGLAWRSQGYAFGKDVTGFKNMPGSLTFYSALTLEETAVG